ncbi:MAG: TetR/AcrR family transcriptional regulator [Acidimicrobiales bacterium]
MTATDSPRPGRPPKVDAKGRATDERLLLAAADACIEYGFEAATLTDIARRADVSTPAIYNHFGSKSELIVEAVRAALARFDNGARSPVIAPHVMLDLFLSPDFAGQRTLILELNLASLRHPDVAELMGEWHQEFAARWAEEGNISIEKAKVIAMVMFGLLGLDSLKAIDTNAEALMAEFKALFDYLVPNAEG